MGTDRHGEPLAIHGSLKSRIELLLRRSGRVTATGDWTDAVSVLSNLSGALLGDKPEKAFFVRCDRSTMTQNDLDNGRLVCLIGVAPLRPAEFVIFRVGQWTADQKS